MHLRNRSRIFFFTILLGALVAGPVHASQSISDEQRKAIMDREMDCISAQMKQNQVSWQDTCVAHYPSKQYDSVKLNGDGFSDYAQDKNEDATYSDWGTSYNYDEFEDFEDNSNDVHYSYGGGAEPGRFLRADIRLLVGPRTDQFDFNIASDITGEATPNIISELNWSDLKLSELRAESRVLLYDHFVFEGSNAYADIYNGDNQDSDYLGDDRTLEFSRSNNAAKDGESMDWSLGTGYRLYLGGSSEWLAANDIWLTMLAGYSYHELDLIATDGTQTLPDSGSFPGLHTNYWSEWKGPWAGFEIEGSRKRIFGIFRFEYHWMDFDATANWNLRTDLEHPTSYHQWADANGVRLGVGGGYHLTDHWDLNIRFNYQDFETDHGVIQFNDVSGLKVQQRLNAANWESKAVLLGSTYRF